MDVRARLDPSVLGSELGRLGLDPVDREVVLDWATQLDEADHARIAVLRDRLVAGWGNRLAEGSAGARSRTVFQRPDATHRLGTGVLPLFALVLAARPSAVLAAGQGYPEDVVRTTQADLGLQVRKYRRVHGVTGLDTQWWMEVVFSTGFARLGRLQFELTRSDLGLPLGGELPVLSVHIPGDGPLEADAVDESLLRASTFFEEHHPELGPIDWFYCRSWLLDPALAHLVPGSNMAAFCARWSVWDAAPRDRDALYFGFDVERDGPAEVPGGLAALPTDTRLHRAMVEHWRTGENFMLCRGRIPVIRQASDDDPTVVP